MLHEEDTSLLLLTPDDRDTIYKMDLERGKVVEEYSTEELTTNGLLPENRYAQREPVKTFLALNRGGIFAIDPRLPKSKVVKSRTFQYQNVKNAMINCGATTKVGHIVVGTKSGEIRLFGASTLKDRRSDSYLDYTPRALNTLPGLGDAIESIDVSSDGDWILATCKEYLLVIPTKTEGNNFTGFEKNLGKNKPAPIRLALSKDDRKKVVGKVHFTPAKFNYNGEEPSSILTSTGHCTVSWNFAEVCRNRNKRPTNPCIKDYGQNVVADDFSHDNDINIIVAMPDDVRLAKNKK